MEDFYRRQRKDLGYLIDPDGEPTGGRWNFDDENREPPPKGDTNPWADPQTSKLDDLDREVIADLEAAAEEHGGELWGAEPDGTWATSRRAALSRLRHFVDDVLQLC